MKHERCLALPSALQLVSSAGDPLGSKLEYPLTTQIASLCFARPRPPGPGPLLPRKSWAQVRSEAALVLALQLDSWYRENVYIYNVEYRPNYPKVSRFELPEKHIYWSPQRKSGFKRAAAGSRGSEKVQILQC